MTDAALKGRRILVAEDNPELAKGLCAAFVAGGAEPIGPAARVSEALALVEATAPDAAIIALDLDGEVVTSLVIALLNRHVPLALAMDDIHAYPSFWPMLPRCPKPVGLADLVAALREEAGRQVQQAARPGHGSIVIARISDDKGGRPLQHIIRDNIQRYREERRREVERLRAANPPRKIDPSEIPVITLDASGWRNVLDLYAALGDALGVPGHSTNLDGWSEIIVDGALNARPAPYAIRIAGTANCRPGLKAEIELLARVIRDAREERLGTSVEEVEVSIRIEP